MKHSEIVSMETSALEAELVSLMKAQLTLRMERAVGQLTNTSQIAKTRKTIARIKTVLTARKLNAKKTGVN